MANTYTLISSNVLGSDTASVTFSSIPSTYTDLVLRGSVRINTSPGLTDLYVRLNNDANPTGFYSDTWLQGNGGTASSSRLSNQDAIYNAIVTPGNAVTASTFSNIEIYIPSYTSSTNKPFSSFAVTENNSTTAYINNAANLWRNTSAINRIDLIGAANIVAGSSFYLYGIKKN